MELVLKQANDIISKQKDEINRLKEGAEYKDKIRKLEADHVRERKES